jgi:hypothetical protein
LQNNEKYHFIKNIYSVELSKQLEIQHNSNCDEEIKLNSGNCPNKKYVLKNQGSLLNNSLRTHIIIYFKNDQEITFA